MRRNWLATHKDAAGTAIKQRHSADSSIVNAAAGDSSSPTTSCQAPDHIAMQQNVPALVHYCVDLGAMSVPDSSGRAPPELTPYASSFAPLKLHGSNV